MSPRAPNTIPIDLAIQVVKQTNRDPLFLANDALMRANFRDADAALEPDSVLQRVYLLDALWNTQLRMDRGAHVRLASALSAQAGEIRDRIAVLSDDALEEDPESVVDAAANILPVMLEARDDNGVGKIHYSFASKYLHWTTRKHFPIMDGRARIAINRFQRSQGARSPIRSDGTGRNWHEDYPRWIRFFSELIRGMTASERDALVDADRDSQVIDARAPNSLLRIWDKVFYTIADWPPPAEFTH